MTRIQITIDELILDGAPHLDQGQLAAALEQALAQEIAARGLPTAVSLPQVRRDVDGLTAGTVAGQIAQTVYGGQR